MLPVVEAVCFSDSQTPEAVVESELMGRCELDGPDRNDGAVVLYCSYDVRKSVKFGELVGDRLLVFCDLGTILLTSASSSESASGSLSTCVGATSLTALGSSSGFWKITVAGLPVK